MKNFTCDDLAIDLGSTNTLIFRMGKGIIVNEPSLVAFHSSSGTRSPIGLGGRAKELLDQGPLDEISVVKPVQYGRLWDLEAGREMIAGYLERVKRWWTPTLRVIANAPVLASEEERTELQDALKWAGAREVYLLEQPRALAAGAGLDLSEERSTMIVDIGGSITEMAVITGGRIMHARSLPIAGDHMDLAIACHIRERYMLRIGLHDAEQIKIRHGNIYPAFDADCVTVNGYHLAEDLPGSVTVNAHEIREALSDPVTSIVTAIKEFIGDLSLEESVDILDRGIALAGGGALLPGLDRLLEREILFPVCRVKDPLTCVVRGSGGALRYIDQFRQSFQ
jgi:rod shape-determining protein MreB